MPLAKSDKEFDASVKGAHTVSTRSQQLPGVEFTIIRVDNAKPGQKPSVTFIGEGQSGQSAGHLEDRLAEPGDDRSDDGLQRLRLGRCAQSERSRAAQYVYTFNAALPDKAAGTFAVGIEGYRNVDHQSGHGPGSHGARSRLQQGVLLRVSETPR